MTHNVRLARTHHQLRSRRPLGDEDLGDSTILPKVLIAPERRDQLGGCGIE